MALLQQMALTDQAAKLLIFEIFAQQLLPSRLLVAVTRNYFDPDSTMTDCLPRTRWGLHNSVTRELPRLSPVRAFAANVALGRLFGLTRAEQ